MNRVSEDTALPDLEIVATVVADSSMTLLGANDAFCALTGLPLQDLAQENVSLVNLLPEEAGKRLAQGFSSGAFHFSCDDVRFESAEESQRLWRVTAIRLDEKDSRWTCPVYHLVFTDRSEVNELKRILAFEKKKQDVISSLAEDITFEYDFLSDTLIFADKYRSVFGCDPVIHDLRKRLSDPEAVDPVTEVFREQFREMKAASGTVHEAIVSTCRGEHRWFALFCTLLRDEQGRPVRTIGILRDIDRQKKEQLSLLDKSRLDAMTGLLNKSTTEERIRAALETVGPNNVGVLLMIDVDFFKRVNDTLGHLAGDEVLLQIVRQLRKTFREDDIIGRVGGDEFHIFLQDVKDTAFVSEKANRLCQAIQHLFEQEKNEPIVTISIGIAVTGKDKTYHELFRQADIALYHAKANGKNRFVFYGQDLNRSPKPFSEVSALTVGSVRDGILVDILDVLFSTADVSEGIWKGLEFVGHALQIDRILVFEKSLDMKRVSATYEWAVSPKWQNRSQYQDCAVSELNMPSSREANGIYYCSDLSRLTDTEKTFLKGSAPVAYLQCDIVQDDRIVGYISFEEYTRQRIWTQQEIDALVLMAKMIGERIRQQHSVQLLSHSYHTMRAILNGLSGVYIYVIDENKNILYFNDNAFKWYPKLHRGMKCYRVLRNRNTPCSACPENIVREKGHLNKVVHDTPFGHSMNVSVSKALWENREWAYIALFSERLPTEEEQEQQKKRAAYVTALCNTCDHLVDVDAQTGRCEMLARAEQRNSYFLPDSADYPSFLAFVAHTYVKEPYRLALLEKFSLDAMRKTFSSGASRVEMEYELHDEGSGLTVWKERAAFPYTLDDGALHILFYVRDVTKRKQDELQRKQDTDNFITALQSNYAEIYRIDLETNLISPLYYNQDQIPITAGSMNYTEFVGKRANDRVHPNDLHAVLSFYDIDNVRALLACAGVSELEYRKRQTFEGDYEWVVATVRLVQGDAGKALLFLRDVTRLKKMEKTVRSLEMRYNAVFRQTIDVATEIDLETESYLRTFFDPEKTDAFTKGIYSRDFPRFLERVHPDDRQTVDQYRSIHALRQLYACDRKAGFCQYRIWSGEEYVWVFSRVFFLHEDNGVTAFILARDITAQKQVEEERNLETQRFNLAIRNTYSEIYETDLKRHTTRLIYSNSKMLVPTEEEENLAAFSERCIHPDDRLYFRNGIASEDLSERFAAGEEQIQGEYRRLGRDGQWYWVSAIVVPLYGSYDHLARKGLCFVRDITDRKKQEQQQKMAEQYDRALRQIYDELYEINVTRDCYRIVYHVDGKYKTPAATGTLTATLPEIAGNMIHPDDAQRFLAFFDLETMRQSFRQGKDYRIAEFRKLWQDEQYHWASLTVFPVTVDEKGDERYLVFIMDIDSKKQAEEIALQNVLLEKQRMADERYKTIIEQTDTLVFEWGGASDSHYVSPEISVRFDGRYDGRELFRVWLEDEVVHEEDRPLLGRLTDDIGQVRHVEVVVRFKKRDGQYAWNRITLSCLDDGDGKPKRYIGTINDVDKATRSVEDLKYRAEYDVLTGIYNMQTFYDRASRLMQARPHEHYTIIRLDIDRFKVINDLYGLEEGDRLLKAIADRLARKMSGNAVYGRISGDIFCACVDYTREKVVEFVREFADWLAEYPLASKVVPSFGLCQVDNVKTPINVLCDWANLALKTVKGSFYPLYAFYDGTLREQILSEKKIENEMGAALANEEFVLYFQPKVAMATSRIVGAEGLVRWVHPVEGMIGPDQFIPLFEKNGFIIQLDEYVWERACRCLREWIDQGHEIVPVSINVSRLHLHDSGLVAKLIGLIKKYELDPKWLELELTESLFFENAGLLIETISNLQKEGFRFSLDDFGAGYSSLNMLKSLEVETIKLDRGFFNEVIVTPRGKTVVAHTISLAKALNIEVVAEGVENREQVDFLLKAGCSLAQGYYYSAPVDAATFGKLAFDRQYLYPDGKAGKALNEEAAEKAHA